VADQFLQGNFSIDRLHIPFQRMEFAADAAGWALRRRSLAGRKLVHLPLLELAAELPSQFMALGLDDGVVWDSLDRPIGPAQLDLDLRRLAQKSFQPFFQPNCPIKIRRVGQTFF